MKTSRPLALVIMGVSGSGKTTIGKLLAKKTGFTFIDADEFHPPSNIEKMKQGVPLNDDDRVPWLETLHTEISKFLRKKENCILACSALKHDYRRMLDNGLEANIKFIHLDGTIDTIRDRMASRSAHFMPPDLLASQFVTLEYPVEAMVYPIDSTPEQITEGILYDLSEKAEFGVIGMGVMGSSISRNLARHNFKLALYNREVKGKEESLAVKLVDSHPPMKDALAFNDLNAFVQSLQAPRKILLMIPSGEAVDEVIEQLSTLLSPGDAIIDGGNSHYEKTGQRNKKLKQKGICFLGCGISGGEKGALNGPSLMPGGQKTAYLLAAPFLKSIAARDKQDKPCCSFLGQDGAGHFVKMVHNGIEYAEMQLLAEMYFLMKQAGYSPEDMHKLFTDFNKGEMSGYLLEITANIMNHYENGELLLEQILDKAGNKGTGSWATIAAAKTGVPATMIGEALFARYLSFFREKRKTLEDIYPKKQTAFKIDPEELMKACQLARIINHSQGFDLLRQKARQETYSYQLHEVARLWTNGCIIRSELMDQLSESLKTETEIFMQREITEKVKIYKPFLTATVTRAMSAGIAVPVLSSALNYLNGMTTARGPANMIQAQRDYFGAHKYQKINDDTQEFYHTQWE